MSRTNSQPITLTVRQAVDILRADPSMSNEVLFAKLGRSSAHAAAEARRLIRSEWARTSRTAAAQSAPVVTPPPSAPPPPAPTAAPDVDAAMELLSAALAATGQRLVSVTVSTTTTLTPRGGAS